MCSLSLFLSLRLYSLYCLTFSSSASCVCIAGEFLRTNICIAALQKVQQLN